MIKVIMGTIFGVFFVAPVLTFIPEKIDTSGIEESLKDTGHEILKMSLEVIQNAI